MRAKALAGLAALGCALAFVAGSAGTTTPLPGGTSLDVTITSPADGATLPLGPVVVNGTAAVGTGAPVANTTLIYVVDVSGSTSSPTGVPGKCPRQNVYDGLQDTTLDCELLAIRDLNTAAVATGTIAKIGMIGFAGNTAPPDTLSPLTITSAAALDLDPTSTTSNLVAPDANTFTPVAGMTTVFPPTSNLDWVVQSAYLGAAGGVATVGWPVRGPADGFSLFSLHDVGAQTNYTAALYALRNLLTQVTTPNTVVAFVSDGVPNLTVQGQPMATVLATLPTSNLTIDTFAVGVGTCGSAGATLNGSLEQISAHFGKHCQVLSDASDAVDIIPDVVASKLTAVSLSVDGGAASSVTSTPAIPAAGLKGPTTVSWTQTLTGLAPGTHHVCATAAGSDGGGPGSTEDCIDITLVAPPTVTVGDGSGSAGTTNEGSAFPISATSSSGTTAWTESSGHCTFADPSSPSTSVTCDDNGVYTLMFTASDGVNPPVSGSEALTVQNVAPTPTLTLSPGPYPVGASLTASVSIADPGVLDTEVCDVNWGDGSPDTIIPADAARMCSVPHAYANPGPYTISVVVTDKDGGQGIDSAHIGVNGPPTVVVGDASGNEGSTIPVSATATDPDGDPLTYGWTATPLSGVAGGASCTFANPSAPSTTVTCNDNGVWTITFTAADGINPAVSRSAALTVFNVNPHPTLTFVPAPPHPLGSSITADVSIVDPGSIDSQTCVIDWGDGTPPTTVIAGGPHCAAPHTYAAYGNYHVTVTDTDKDGGVGTDTQVVFIDGPPTVTLANASGNEGAPIPLAATATDPEGDALTYAWTATAGAGVDAGAACTFAGPTVLSTTVTCTDDGMWTLTLTASDGVNPPVVTTATLTVANVAPSVTIMSPAAGSTSRSVSFSATVTDPGTNDTLSCAINWGDGTAASTVPVAGGVCTTTHTYAGSVQSATITVTASDDNGGTKTATRSLSFNAPPVCANVHANPDTLWPPNGDMRLVQLVGAYDPDGGPVTYTITGVTQDEALGLWQGHDYAWFKKWGRKPEPDAVILHGPYLLLRAYRDPHGDGRTYTISFTVTDSKGATCSGTTTVEVPLSQGHHPKRGTKHYNSCGWGWKP